MKIAVVGNLGNIGYAYTRAMREIGHEADLFITCKKHKIIDSQNPWNSENPPDKNILWIKTIETDNIFSSFIECARKLPKYDVVLAITTSPIYCQFFTKKLISICTGSDIRDYVWQKGVKPWLLKQSYKKSYHIFVPFSEMHWAPQKIGIEKKSSPLFVAINPQPFDEIKTNQKNNKLTIFCPASWIINRHDSKGLNKLLNAITNLLDQGYDFNTILIDHSKNENVSIEDKTYILEKIKKYPLNIKIIDRIKEKKDLIKEYKKCDLVADQFSIGMFGLVGMEALCSQKALMAYFDKKSDRFYDGETPPILNCYQENEIFDTLKKILDREISRENLLSLGQKGYDWIIKWHDEKTVIKSMIKKIQ